MEPAKCPVCGCRKFYIKHPDDEYEIYAFTCEDGEVCFEEDAVSPEKPPAIGDDTETYCSDCSWHDSFKKVKIEFK